MNYLKKFRVTPGSKVKLADFDPDFSSRKETKKSARRKSAELQERMSELQFELYAEQKQSLLICLQAPDAGGKDGVVRHVFAGINPQGCRAVSFKEPSAEELSHDFLWRIEKQVPRCGEIVIFNRSHYEDVLVVRVHDLVSRAKWSQRFAQINDFERNLVANGTRILKFFLHISKEEQLERFKDRLDDPTRQWKISEADYTERDRWPAYETAYEDVFAKCSAEEAPWFIIPSNHKWFRDLAISEIIVRTLEDMAIKVPAPTVNIADIRLKYHEAVGRAKAKKSRAAK
ncbi:MAG TPA: polyphosphate kinase 2 family protein [Lacunisphaera sp.]|jgi:PPK2 family polyphosphate:nucleotide phosphotransferase